MSNEELLRAPLIVEEVAPTDPLLEATWRRLQENGGVRTPFLAWEWFSAFADEPSLSQHCRVVVVRPSRGPAVGLFPVDVVPGPARTRVLRSAGGDSLAPDHLDVVAAEHDLDIVAGAVARHLARELPWDVADLDGLAGGGGLARALAQEFRLPYCMRRPPILEPVPVIRLDGPGSEQLLAKLRRRAARGMKSVEREGGGYSVVEDAAAVAGLMGSLMALHNDRFGDRSTAFSTPTLRRFHVNAASRLAGSGLARIGRLSTATQDIGLEYVLLLGDRAYAYQSGFSPDGGHSPGRTVECRSVLTAAEEGRVEYDLLRGNEAYKSEYATGEACDVRVRGVRGTPAAIAWLGLRAARRLRAKVRRADADGAQSPGGD